MASPDIVYSVALATPLLTTFLFRSNAAILFFAAGFSSILARSIDSDVVGLIRGFLPGVSLDVVRFGILLIPILIFGLIFRKSITNNALAIHALMAIAGGAILALALPSLFTGDLAINSNNSSIAQYVLDYGTFVVLAGGFLSVVLLYKKIHLPKDHHK